jgi:hypothetical protein
MDDVSNLKIEKLVPVRDMVLVRLIHDNIERRAGHMIFEVKQDEKRKKSTLRGVVVRCGRDVVALKAGDVVLLERTMYHEDVKFALVPEWNHKTDDSDFIAVLEKDA